MADGLRAAATTPAAARRHAGPRSCRAAPTDRGPPRAAAAPRSPLLLPAVGIDVEYAHWRAARSGGGAPREVAVAAWVAVVDEGGAVLVDARIRQRCQLPPDEAGAPWRHWGGVPWDEGAAAAPAAPPPLPREDVLRALLPHLEGRLVVGHGVARDAEALGLAAEPLGSAAAGAGPLPPGFLALRPRTAGPRGPGAPPALAPRLVAYDTKAFPGFQGRGGVARSLARLAREHLGRRIQQGRGNEGAPGTPERPELQPPRGRQRQPSARGGRAAGRGPRAAPSLHDAVEDAAGVAALFVRVARPRLLLDAAAAAGGAGSAGADAFERLVELHTAALLGGMGGGAGGVDGRGGAAAEEGEEQAEDEDDG